MSDDPELVVVAYPLGWRVAATLLFVASTLLLSAFLTPFQHVELSARLFFGCAALWSGVCAYRAATGPEVSFRSERLVFRKIVRTQTFERADVVGFESGAWTFNGTQKVAIRLADGSVKSVALDGPMGRGELFERIVDEGNAWLRDPDG